jgi:hypothetical protein
MEKHKKVLTAPGEDWRHRTAELRGGKEEQTGEANWKMDLLSPILDPDPLTS